MKAIPSTKARYGVPIKEMKVPKYRHPTESPTLTYMMAAAQLDLVSALGEVYSKNKYPNIRSMDIKLTVVSGPKSLYLFLMDVNLTILSLSSRQVVCVVDTELDRWPHTSVRQSRLVSVRTTKGTSPETLLQNSLSKATNLVIMQSASDLLSKLVHLTVNVDLEFVVRYT